MTRPPRPVIFVGTVAVVALIGLTEPYCDAALHRSDGSTRERAAAAATADSTLDAVKRTAAGAICGAFLGGLFVWEGGRRKPKP